MAEYPGPIDSALFQGKKDPLGSGFAVGGSGTPIKGIVTCKKSWGVERITLSCSGKTSMSFKDPGHAAIPAGISAPGRFYFAPNQDKVTVAWQLKNPTLAQKVTLELFRANSSTPIWKRTLSTEDTMREKLPHRWTGKFPPTEWTAPVDFPDSVVTVEHSPYMLKITAIGDAEEGFVERWTYFDVLVHALRLSWGGAALIPNPPPGDIDAKYHATSIPAEGDLVRALAATAIGAPRHTVALSCEQFSQDEAESLNGTHGARHALQWGDGPRIPLVASVVLRAANDAPTLEGDPEVSKAIGGARFLWDWESEDQLASLNADYANVPLRTFLRDSLDYKLTDPGGPPGSTNCHQDHGGKRGAASTVFPKQTDATAFPYADGLCAKRVWAATSLCLLDGARAGTTGVLFRPSRIAKDTYKVSVYLATPTTDVASDGTTLRANHPGLPSASTGVFEVQRRVRCTYITKAPTMVDSNVANSAAEYRKAGVELVWTAGPALGVERQRFRLGYSAWCATVLDPAGALIDPDTRAADPAYRLVGLNLVRRWSRAFEGIDQLDGQDGTHAAHPAACIVWDWPTFYQKYLVDQVRDYVVNKPRKINTPRGRYNKWRAAHPLPADDSAYLMGVFGNLSTARQGQLNQATSQVLLGANLATTAAEYDQKLSPVCLQFLKLVAQQYAIGTAEPCLTCVHTVDLWAYRDQLGTFTEKFTDVGGLGPADATFDSGARALNLMFIPEIVTMARAADPATYHVPATPVLTHEIGHNFYLAHAPAAPDSAKHVSPNRKELHDAADMRCLMNYDIRSDHLCGFCNLVLRGWATHASGAWVALSNDSAQNHA